MESYESLIDKELDCLTPRAKYERVMQLLKAEKELSKAMGLLQAWEIFRSSISEKYPELLVWCPEINASYA